MHPFVNVAINAARSAGTIIARAFDNLDRITIEQKSPFDWVTSIDKIAEAKIIETIEEHYPKHRIIAEESGVKANDSEVTWIIDPIDGTTNFLNGVPHFAVSIGIVDNGQIRHGVIYDPIRDELFVSSKGYGAQLNSRKIRVSTCDDLERSLLATSFFNNSLTDNAANLNQLYESSTIRMFGSAALNLAYVAAGRLSGYWEVGLKSWDLAAGILLVQEAGGMVCDFQKEQKYLETGNIIASNAKLHKSLLNFICPN